MNASMFKRLTTALSIGVLAHGYAADVRAQTFTYDALNRVSRATYPNGSSLNFTYDAMGNVLSTSGAAGPFAASVTLTATSPVASGQGVTITASVTGASPAGTVQFRDGSAPLGSPVLLASGVAQLVQGGLTPGVHAITASYSGDSANLPSTSAAFGVTVTGITVTVSNAAGGADQPVTLTASVIGATPAGTVQFRLNGANVGAPVTLINGVARLTLPSSTIGSAAVTAVYNGDANNVGLVSDPVVQSGSTTASGDVPLPAWALWLLGAGLMASLRRRTCGQPAP